MRRSLVIAVLALFASPCALAQTTVVLRTWAKAPADQAAPITLGDVAELKGDDAAKLAGVVVVAAPRALAKSAESGWITVDVDMVRTALDESGLVNWGTVMLSGSRCAIRAGDPPARVAKPSTAKADRAVRPQPADEAPTGTVRAAILARLAALYEVSARDLRVVFDAGRNAAALDEPVAADEAAHVEPAASSASGRVPVRVDVYRADQIVRSFDVTVKAEVRRPVLVTSRTLERGDTVDDGALATDSRWISPGAQQPLTAEHAVGAIAKRRVLAGTAMTAADVQAPMVVSRGDEVWVHVLSGGMRMKVKARAMASARDGELVKFQVEGSKKLFEARMSGRGVAVMVVDESSVGPVEPAPLNIEWTEPEAQLTSKRVTPPKADAVSASGWDIDPAELDKLADEKTAAKSAEKPAAKPPTGNLKWVDIQRDKRSPTLKARTQSKEPKR